MTGPENVRLHGGPDVEVPTDALADRTGPVAVGIRPEKIEIGHVTEERNTLTGHVVEQAYIGVATQYIVETPCGRITVYVQNATAAAGRVSPGERVALSWAPESTFVVDATEETE